MWSWCQRVYWDVNLLKQLNKTTVFVNSIFNASPLVHYFRTWGIVTRYLKSSNKHSKNLRESTYELRNRAKSACTFNGCRNKVGGKSSSESIQTLTFVMFDNLNIIVVMHTHRRDCSNACADLSTLRPRQIGRHFADDIFKYIFLCENYCNLFKCHWYLFPSIPLTTTHFRNQALLTPIYATRPWWV